MIILIQDQFGEEVSTYLSSRMQIEVFNICDVINTPSAYPEIQNEIVAIILSQPLSSLLNNFSSLAIQYQISWLPLYINRTSIHLGPRYQPGLPGCYSCYQKRELTSLGIHGLSEAARVIQGTPDTNLRYFKGYIEPMVKIAGEMLLQEQSVNPQKTSQVRSMDILSGDVLSGKVIATHGCSCRPKVNSSSGKDRFWENIKNIHSKLGEE